MAQDVSTDRRLIALGATFDEITAAMERVPDGEAIPEVLHDGLARVTNDIEELVGTCWEAIQVKEHVRRYCELIEAEDLELGMARSLLGPRRHSSPAPLSLSWVRSKGVR
jgi:hypothetical protein